jgi:hypothetical protein
VIDIVDAEPDHRKGTGERDLHWVDPVHVYLSSLAVRGLTPSFWCGEKLCSTNVSINSYEGGAPVEETRAISAGRRRF